MQSPPGWVVIRHQLRAHGPDPQAAGQQRRKTIRSVNQSGLGMPNRDYSMHTDKKTVATDKLYVETVLKPDAKVRGDARGRAWMRR